MNTIANLEVAARIATLLDEAASAGDFDQVELCNAALEGDQQAWDACKDVLDAADLERDQA